MRRLPIPIRAIDMKQLITSLLTIFSFGVIADSEISTPAFKLKLSEGWIQEPTNDTEQCSYYSHAKDIGIMCSYILMNAKLEDTDRIAKKLIEFRLGGEEAAANKFNLKMTISEPFIAPFSKGHQVAYFGHDSSNRQFRYLGVVMPSKAINIYAESSSKSQAELEEEFNTLLKGLSLE